LVDDLFVCLLLKFFTFVKRLNMSKAISFDTLAYAKKLTAAGFTQQQAEVQAEALAEIIDERIATKEDIMDLKREMKEMELRIVIRVGAMLAATIAILVSLLKFM